MLRITSLVALFLLASIAFKLYESQVVLHYSMTSFRNGGQGMKSTLSKFEMMNPETCEEFRSEFGQVEGWLHLANGNKILCCNQNSLRFYSVTLKICVDKTAGLVHYWPLQKDGNDLAGNNHLVITGPIWSSGRLDRPDAALKLTGGGFGKFPTGSYFKATGFTITVWAKFYSMVDWHRILDFGQGQGNENLLFCFYYDESTINFSTFVGGVRGGTAISSEDLSLDTWYNIALTLTSNENGIATIYVNGISVGTTPDISYKDMERTSNYLGKSNWDQDQPSDGSFSDLKIFERVLSAEEIVEEKDYFYSG